MSSTQGEREALRALQDLKPGVYRTCDTGSCAKCGGYTSSGSYRYCPECAWEIVRAALSAPQEEAGADDWPMMRRDPLAPQAERGLRDLADAERRVGRLAPKVAQPDPAMVRQALGVLNANGYVVAAQILASAVQSGAPPVAGSRETERFFRLIRLHSHEVPEKELAHHRVPAGTRFVGRLYIAPDGELVVTDGWPADEDAVADDHPDAHNCDEMGCSTLSHVVARLRAPAPGTGEGMEIVCTACATEDARSLRCGNCGEAVGGGWVEPAPAPGTGGEEVENG